MADPVKRSPSEGKSRKRRCDPPSEDPVKGRRTGGEDPMNGRASEGKRQEDAVTHPREEPVKGRPSEGRARKTL